MVKQAFAAVPAVQNEPFLRTCAQQALVSGSGKVMSLLFFKNKTKTIAIMTWGEGFFSWERLGAHANAVGVLPGLPPKRSETCKMPPIEKKASNNFFG